MSDTNHVDAIRGMMDTILVSAAWSGASPEERTALMDHYRSIMDHADALQRERDEARAELAAERARVNDLMAFLRFHDFDGEFEEVVGDPVLRRGVLGDLPDEGEVTT